MIKIERYEYPKVELLFNNNVIGAFNNDIELLKVQVQIAESNLTGYSIRFNNQVSKINDKGELEEWFLGMYDESQKQFSKLFKLRQK